ncbi:hypothetical protein [Helicobacter phage Pt4497U]|nr:hypothetical protein [Helicobacter phage Pt4497U]
MLYDALCFSYGEHVKKITLKIIAFLRYYSFDLNYKGK